MPRELQGLNENMDYRVLIEKLCPEIQLEVKGEVFGEIRYKGERVGFFQNEK